MSYQGVPQNEGDVIPPNPPHSEHESKSPLVYSTEASPSPVPSASFPRPESYGGRPGSRVSMAIGKSFRHKYGDIAPPQWSYSDDDEPGHGLQTQYDPLKARLQSQLARKHAKGHQFWHLLGKVALRLVSTIILCAAMIGCFRYFETVKILTDLEKNVFNVLSTGIYLTMGLNMAGAFKGMATMLRWKILSRKPHNLKEVDMILGLNSLVKVYKLGIEGLGFRKPGTFFLCWLWILVNLIARVSIALTGLTYSYDSAGGVATIPGQAFISDKTAFWPLGYKEDQLPPTGAQYQTAHTYGEASSILVDTDHPTAKESEHILGWNEATESWEYTFRTWNNTAHTLEALTNRTISINATCTMHEIIQGQDGTLRDITYLNSTDSQEYIFGNITVRGAGATVWANPNMVNYPAERPACQNYLRCALVYGFQFINPEFEKGNGKLFECYVNVGRVTNVVGELEQLPDALAWTAAGAIGLDGFTDDVDAWLYQRYFLGTQFGQRIADKDPHVVKKKMARQVSRFAAGVIAILDSDNPPVSVFGEKPWAGVLFKVNWLNLCLILGGITVAQALLGLAAVIWANTVFVKDDSYLSTARLLRPLVERLGPSGCALTGEEIAHTLKTAMVYGVRVDEKAQRHHLDLGEDIRPVSKFPAGWYDGETGDMRPYCDEDGQEQTEEEEEERVLREREEEMLLLA